MKCSQCSCHQWSGHGFLATSEVLLLLRSHGVAAWHVAVAWPHDFCKSDQGLGWPFDLSNQMKRKALLHRDSTVVGKLNVTGIDSI